MVDSLRDQLLKNGFVPQPREPARTPPARKGNPGGNPPPAQGKRRPAPVQPARSPRHKQAARDSDDDINLAKAYAIRAQTEAQERKRVEREAVEQARIKRENKQKVQRLLEGQSLNKAEADQVRHFEYGGKIRRVYVDSAQLAALNAGQLGIIQQAGRYLLVSRAIAEQIRAIDPHPVALLVDPTASTSDDGVPDDLMW